MGGIGGAGGVRAAGGLGGAREAAAAGGAGEGLGVTTAGCFRGAGRGGTVDCWASPILKSWRIAIGFQKVIPRIRANRIAIAPKIIGRRDRFLFRPVFFFNGFSGTTGVPCGEAEASSLKDKVSVASSFSISATR